MQSNIRLISKFLLCCLLAVFYSPLMNLLLAGEESVEIHPITATLEDFQISKDDRAIILVGDIMTWDRTRPLIEKHGSNYPYQATATLLKSADITVGNLEGPVAVEATKSLKRNYSYRVPPETLEGLKWAGFDLLSLANNHLDDCGLDGMRETTEYLSSQGLAYFGYGKNFDQAATLKILKLGELKIGFLAFVAPETYLYEYKDAGEKKSRRNKRLMTERLQATKTRPGTVVAEIESMRRMVAEAKQEADLVIIFIHFGIRYHRPPSEFQKAFSHAAVDAGADLIVGHHAHIWQAVEKYRGKAIVYGVGNFAFGSANRRADEALLVRAVFKNSTIDRLELFPLYTKNRDAVVNYQPKIMKGKSALKMLSELKRKSKKLNAEIELKKTHGVLSLR